MLRIFDEGTSREASYVVFAMMLLFVSYREEAKIHKLKTCMCCIFKRGWSYG
jgi:hypothetical protein